MTQRSIFAGTNQEIVIKAGSSVTIRGHDSDQVTAETKGKWGLTLERRSESEIGRARAAVGDHVLFDVRIKLPSPLRRSLRSASQSRTGRGDAEVIEVQMGGSGEVLVPFESNLKVYAGKDIDVQSIKGQVDAYSGLSLSLRDVYLLGNASAGWSMNIDCQTMIGKDVTFDAGSDLRFHVADLTSARLRVKDIGGYWEARIGGGEKSVYLKSGGDVTFVTDQKVEPLPPNFILGKIEKPGEA
jgi:hypothetical protein